MPSFVIVNNEFGYGLENSNSPRIYSNIITNEELINLKIESKYPTESFYVNEEVKREFNNIINARMEKQFNKWKKIYDEALATKDSNIINIINLLEKKKNWQQTMVPIFEHLANICAKKIFKKRI